MKKLLIILLLIITQQAKSQITNNITNIAVYDVQILVDSDMCTIYVKWTKPPITLDVVYGYKVWINDVILCYNDDCNLIPGFTDSIVTAFPALKGLTYSTHVITYYYKGGSIDSGMPANITDVLDSRKQVTTIGTTECIINCEMPTKTKLIKTYNK